MSNNHSDAESWVELFCNLCALEQPADAQACTKCGGPLNRRQTVTVRTVLSTHDSQSMKLRRPGVKKPLIEAKQGDSYHVMSGTWRTLNQRVDRTARPPRYTKKVVGEDGVVYKDVDVPLYDQGAHGPQNGVLHTWRPASRCMLDTNIYDKIVATPGLSSRLAQLDACDKLVIVQTHLQHDELANIPDDKKRRQVLAIAVESTETSGAVWGLSRWGQATWGDGSGNLKLSAVASESGGHLVDALIAVTAVDRCDMLVTEDRRLSTRVRAASNLRVLNFAEFLDCVAFLEVSD